MSKSLRPSNRHRWLPRAFIGFAAALALPAAAQSWNNPASGDWFDASNWNPGAVPATGDAVVVSNGGTARLVGVPATDVLQTLDIGITGSGTGVGTVVSEGVSLRVANAVSLATLVGAGSESAVGLLQLTGGAVGEVGGLRAGFAFIAPQAVRLDGHLDAADSFVVNGGALVAGQIFGGARGSEASGVANIGNDAGRVDFLVAGDVVTLGPDGVGSRAMGSISIGGDLAVTALGSVGTAIGEARIADATAPGGFRINRAIGEVRVGGKLSIAPTASSLAVGTTGSGVASGSLSIGTLDVAVGHAIRLSVGNALLPGGEADGRLTASVGDLGADFDVGVGTAVAGTARGNLSLGGKLIGNGNGLLRVGTVLNPDSADTRTSAFLGSGVVAAAGGISGFTGIDIAALTGPQTAGSRAEGRVTGGADAATSSISRFISVGVVLSTIEAASAEGVLELGSSVTMNDRNLVAGQVASAGRGSSARGLVQLANVDGHVRNAIIGSVALQSDSDIGSTATATVGIDGNMTVSRYLGIATATSVRVDDSAAPGGVRFDRADATLRIGGALSIVEPFARMEVGTTVGGAVDGALQVGSMAMLGNQLSRVDIGTSDGNGHARGTVEIDGGLLRTDTLRIGVAAGGSAVGRLALARADLDATTVLAGGGVGMANFTFSDSQSRVLGDMELLRGTLELERSALRVGNIFTLGAETSTRIEIDGLLRGSQFGSVDAAIARLDGQMEFDFGDLDFMGPSAFFDVIRSASVNGIDGDFDTLSFVDLVPGYRASAGIELDAGVQVYRVRLARAASVPAPTTALLLLVAFTAIARMRRHGHERRGGQ